MKTIVHVVGARPNFMKVAPIHRALARHGGFRQRLIHTGQHHDDAMSGVFFEELGLPTPDASLGVGSGSHAEQTARVMLALEPILLAERPDLVSVVGDINSTVAAALVTSKLNLALGHVEAGLRSFDRTMPEEVNRIVTDRLADVLLTPSEDADRNLHREGVDSRRIARVGNVMIDSLHFALPQAQERRPWERLELPPGGYALCTLHRAGNVDEKDALERLVEVLGAVARRLPLVFPLHPRTRARLDAFGLAGRLTAPGLHLVPPQGYLEFLGLMANARVVLTDSGGLQEETTALGVPCLTLRENTERPVTVELGTNTVVGTDPRRILDEVDRVLHSGGKRGRIPPLWDGRAADRVATAYARFLAMG